MIPRNLTLARLAAQGGLHPRAAEVVAALRELEAQANAGKDGEPLSDDLRRALDRALKATGALLEETGP